MNIDYNISDDELKLIIREVMDDAFSLDNPNDFADTIMYPHDELKQFIVLTIYFGGVMDNAWDESTLENNFRRRILCNFLEMMGKAKKVNGEWIEQ
jgi:hypothetical protein